MKKGLLLLVSAFFTLAVSAQVVVFTENFESPSFDDSVTSTTTSGVKNWELSNKYSVSGNYSDTATVGSAATYYLTTDFFNTTGNTYVLLEFNQICKITFFDNAEIEVSGDSGQTWNKLTDQHYLGTASFGGLGGRFAESSYGSLWAPAAAIDPTPAWWKNEIFDISAFAASATHAAVRFKLSDGGPPGPQSRYGWLIDDIKVTAALSELTPPNIISFTPSYNGNIAITSPIQFAAEITDASGLQSVFVAYTINGVPDTLYLNNSSGNNWTGTFSALNHLDNVCYKLVAIDNSLSHNVAYSPQFTSNCFTASTEEAALLAINSPNTACGLGMEEVEIRIKNTGYTTIAGDLWASYWIVGTTDTVTEYIPDTILVNGILDYTFDSLVDVSATAGNITYQLKAKIDLTGDPVPTNNSQTKIFISGFVPPEAPVLTDTINYATTATLVTVIPGAEIKWYADSLGTQLLYVGNSFTTPILFSDTVYYRNATSIGSGLPCTSLPRPYYVNVGDKPSFDAAITEVSQPVSAINMLSQEKVVATVVNFGGDTIWGFPVNYSINNNTPITETISDTLNPGDSLFYQFNAFADLSTPGNYQFKVWVALPGDTTYLNDTINKLVVHSIPNFCQSYAVNAATGSDIGNVYFSNLNNGSASPPTNNPNAVNGYTDYTTSAPSVQLAVGLTYNFSVTRIMASNLANTKAGVKVFIDFDRSGTYDEATETAFSGTINHYLFQTGGMITIPNWVNPGVTQMRVVLQETNNINSVHACGVYGTGETEDYTVVMYPQIPYDGGVSAVITPGALVPEASLQTVNVAIKNYGLDTLTVFDVIYEHNTNAPVIEQWTGMLVPGGTTLFQFTTQLTVAGGPNTICAYTDVDDDTNLGNNPSCKSFYGDPLQNAEAVALIDPDVEGCFVGQEQVTIAIKNVGLDTISGGLNAHYYVEGQPSTLTTEPVNATILPNQTYNYTFNATVDLTAYVQDTVWTVIGYTTLVGDFETYNDSTSTDVESLYSPPDPLVTNATIQYGQTATLTASSPDSIFWYETETSQNELMTGPTYTTPTLYGQEIYWVEAQTDGGATSVNIGNGTTTQNYIPCYGFYDYGWSACIYTANELNTEGDIDSIGYYVGNSVGGYTMLTQKIYLTHTTASSFTSSTKPDPNTMTEVFVDDITWTGPGLFKIAFTTPFNYNGDDNILVYWENHDGDYTSGYPNFQYTSTTGQMAMYRYADNSFPTTNGTLTTSRPNIKFMGSGGGCPSNRVPDTVFVQNIPAYDGALLELVEPTTGTNLTGAEPVSVYIKNYGTQSISNFDVSYQINGGTIKTETVSNTLQQLDTLVYTFNSTANLEFYNTYQFKAWISVPNDAMGANDTIYKTVKNNIPEYCPSYATTPSSYEDIGNVTLSNLNNGNPNPSSSNPNASQGYTDYTQLTPAMLSPSVSYPISVSAISSSTISSNTGVKVYIDYNRDGVFNAISERVFSSSSISSTNPTATGTVNVPGTAIPGMTVMRVVLDRNGTAPPCGTYTYGETEDYLVLIIPLIPNDAGVLEIMEPGELGTAGTNVQPKVRIQNFGTNTLNNVNIAYEVNGGTPVTYNYLMPLAPQATAVVNLPMMTLGEGNNNICAYTLVPGDSNTFNDRRCLDCYAEFTADLPYETNFDQPAAHFWPDSVPNQWERGIPSGLVLNTVKSSPNVWGISIDDPYDHNGANFLYTPRFNHLITGIDSISFWHKMDANPGDGGAIQYLSMLGWKLLGSQNDPKSVNWYNSNMNLWTGNGGSAAWIHSAYDLKNVYDMAEPTQFRYIFFTTQENNNDYEGWILDNFSINIPILPKDAGVIEILGPPSPTIIGTDIEVEVRIENFGSDTLFSVPLKYKVNGATVNTGLWTGVLPPDSTTEYTFGPLPAPLVAYTLCALTDVPGDINGYNNTTCDTFDVLPPNYDLTIPEIVTPLSPTIHNDSSEVSVWVVNQGLQPVTNFDIWYSVSNQVVTTETYNDPANPLQPGDSMLYIFNKQYKQDYIGYYYLCAQVSVSGDGYPWNDEKCTILEDLWTEVTESDLEGYAMGQNIPNPANGNTVIPFSLPSHGDYTFTIVNYLGQPVFSTNSAASAGQHQIDIDVSQFTPGAYFYYMEYEGRRLIRKMIVH